ncbi:hypothetical protein CB0940_03616, partial [Cercospora beticola]
PGYTIWTFLDAIPTFSALTLFQYIQIHNQTVYQNSHIYHLQTAQNALQDQRLTSEGCRRPALRCGQEERRRPRRQDRERVQAYQGLHCRVPRRQSPLPVLERAHQCREGWRGDNAIDDD